jgi:hypothetical protein
MYDIAACEICTRKTQLSMTRETNVLRAGFGWRVCYGHVISQKGNVASGALRGLSRLRLFTGCERDLRKLEIGIGLECVYAGKRRPNYIYWEEICIHKDSAVQVDFDADEVNVVE